MFIVLPFSDHRKALRRTGLRQSPRCDKPERRLSGRRRVCWCVLGGGAGPPPPLTKTTKEREGPPPPPPEKGERLVSPHPKNNSKTPKNPTPRGGGGKPHLRDRCRIVRLGDSRERKKRPHLVKKLNHKSIKEGIQMKQNRIFDQNSSQKARSWHYNMDTNRAEAQFADGSAIAIDCLAIEDEYGNTPGTAS